jgi:hypothetical protein
MQSLVIHGILAEEELDPPLLGLESLHDQQMIVPLEDLMTLAGWEIRLWGIHCFCRG